MVRATTLRDVLNFLPAIGETDGKKKLQTVSVLLANGWVYDLWEFDGEDLCFGKVFGFETEIGYVALSEIEHFVIDFSRQTEYLSDDYLSAEA